VADDQVRMGGIEVHVETDAADGLPGAHPLTRVTDELLPALVARLGVSGLGEIEVREGDWRVRLRRDIDRSRPSGGSAAGSDGEAGRTLQATRLQPARGMVTAPAVGYYTPRDGLRVGQAVAAGDVFGWVDVLGVRQDVVAPVSGTVGRLLVEPGQAVEYGQELLQIDPAGHEVATEVIESPEPDHALVAARAAD
jgi:acetyl-CoA carboxylase biotin carboxyl carrier protein